MTRSVPNLRKVKLADLAHACPEASSGPRTKQPRARLERWKMLHLLLAEAWSNPDATDGDLLDRHLGAVSTLEADLIRRMYLNARRILPISDDVEVEVDGTTVHHDFEAQGMTTSVRFTFTLRHPGGATEHVRLKTGRAPTSAEEAAVAWSEAEPGELFVDLMAWPGEIEEIAAPSDGERRLSELIESAPLLNRSGVRPGPACVWCSRAAVCGAFPAGRVVPSSAETLNLTKTDLEQIGQCHRRVAWRRVHGIPRDDGDDVEAFPELSRGRLFHGLVQIAEGADDPAAAVADYLRDVPASEVADLEVMWDNHREMMEREDLTVRTTEFPVGLTLTVGERAEMRGVTAIGFIDLTGRDASEGPVAIELKTGGSYDTGIEDDLYAAGMRKWTGPTEPIVIHRHRVRDGECEVVTYTPEEVDEAVSRLQVGTEPVHDWDWDNPLQPGFSIGPWCAGCEFRRTCEGYR